MNAELQKLNTLMWRILIVLAVVFILYYTAKADTLDNDIRAYIEDCGYEDDGFVDAVIVLSTEFEQDPWLWTMIAFYESRWDSTEIGSAGEKSWVQIHPCHKLKRFKNRGRDWDTATPELLLRVGCEMVQESLDAGRSLWSAYSPWTTRSRAWRRYKDYLDCEPGSYIITSTTTENDVGVQDS